jgi:DNA-binding NarL/FixJ family response regulator
MKADEILMQLTPRVRECGYCLVTGGTTDKEIAERMGISDNVVSVYMKRMFQATGATDRTALALFIVRSGMEDLLREEFEEKRKGAA